MTINKTENIGSKPILDIPCTFSSPKKRAAINKTLRQIMERDLKSFRRLLKIVRVIEPLVEETISSSGYITGGQWVEDPRVDIDPFEYFKNKDKITVKEYTEFCKNQENKENTGVVKLWNKCTTEDIPWILAHELGHAATQDQDLERRGRYCEDELKSELTADWYAYKWGYGRQIALRRKNSDLIHHGPGPGKIYEETFDGKIFHFKITRNFVVKLIKTTEDDETFYQKKEVKEQLFFRS